MSPAVSVLSVRCGCFLVCRYPSGNRKVFGSITRSNVQCIQEENERSHKVGKPATKL